MTGGPINPGNHLPWWILPTLYLAFVVGLWIVLLVGLGVIP